MKKICILAIAIFICSLIPYQTRAVFQSGQTDQSRAPALNTSHVSAPHGIATPHLNNRVSSNSWLYEHRYLSASHHCGLADATSSFCVVGPGFSMVLVLFGIATVIFVISSRRKKRAQSRGKLMALIYLSGLNALFLVQFLAVLSYAHTLPDQLGLKNWLLIACLAFWISIVYWFIKRKDRTYNSQLVSQVIAFCVFLFAYFMNMDYTRTCIGILEGQPCTTDSVQSAPIILILVILLGIVALGWLLVLRLLKKDRKKIEKIIKKSSKTLSPRISKIASIGILAAVAVLLIGGAAYYILTRPPENVIENNDLTYTLRGKVTVKRTSCGLERLQSDGTVKKGGGICDAGNSLAVDDVSISTGGGCLCGHDKYPFYISDIDNVHAGDLVEVRYVKKKDGYKSTDCASCYIKKQNSNNIEKQTAIGKPGTRL